MKDHGDLTCSHSATALPDPFWKQVAFQNLVAVALTWATLDSCRYPASKETVCKEENWNFPGREKKNDSNRSLSQQDKQESQTGDGDDFNIFKRGKPNQCR